jgi:hypothetical protein
MRPEVYPHLLTKFKDVAGKFGLVWEALRWGQQEGGTGER